MRKSNILFYYYGRKKQIAHLYPRALHDTIIEPFAGSAAYSLYGDHWQKRVILLDIQEWVIGIWKYLQAATRQDILNLPLVHEGQHLDNFHYLSRAEKNLIGLHINPGSSVPKKTVTKASRWEAGRRYIAENIYKIKHWVVMQKDYHESPNIAATWFIDPPYQVAGIYYNHPIDYTYLGQWIRKRMGQTIACEGEGACYLPFIPLCIVNNGGLNKGKRKGELVYYAE